MDMLKKRPMMLNEPGMFEGKRIGEGRQGEHIIGVGRATIPGDVPQGHHEVKPYPSTHPEFGAEPRHGYVEKRPMDEPERFGGRSTIEGEREIPKDARIAKLPEDIPRGHPEIKEYVSSPSQGSTNVPQRTLDKEIINKGMKGDNLHV